MFVTFACNSSSSENVLLKEIEGVKNEAIEKHDIVMAQMGAVKSLKDSLLLLESNDEAFNSQVQEAVERLDAADKAMWDWMHHFDLSFTADSDSATLAHFKKKLSAIDQVSHQFDKALLEGRALNK